MKRSLKIFVAISIIIIQLYFFLETFFWQGQIMPTWRFLLGILSPIIIIGFAIETTQKK